RGIPELDVLGDVASRQPRPQPGAEVTDVQCGAVDRGDGPPVTVLDPVGATDAQPAVVAAGDDDVSGGGVGAVGEDHLATRGVATRPSRSRAGVEAGNELA